MGTPKEARKVFIESSDVRVKRMVRKAGTQDSCSFISGSSNSLWHFFIPLPQSIRVRVCVHISVAEMQRDLLQPGEMYLQCRSS